MLLESARAMSGMGLDVLRQVPGGRRLLGAGPTLELRGKTVFVTGAARGLGAEVARQAHQEGANVVLTGRSEAGLKLLRDELGSRALAFVADVTDGAAMALACRAAVEQFGGVDVLVANAGVAPPSRSVLSIDPLDFERTVDVDLLGQWRSVRALLPTIVERQGHVVVISSIYAFLNGALNASYAASKAGTEQLTRALSVELAPHGATAGVAYLGFIDTELAAEVFSQTHVIEARSTVPAFVTRPISVQAAGRAVIRGIQRRSGQVGAPTWVLPLLRARGLLGPVMDEVLIRNARLGRIILDAEAGDPR